jgi:hypothetical protein
MDNLDLSIIDDLEFRLEQLSVEAKGRHNMNSSCIKWEKHLKILCILFNILQWNM